MNGTGHPIRVPVIDLAEVSAGGGSIAWVDRAGSLRVGPKSAGAEPGPVCYGRGGTAPTVTDCNLLLGYLDQKSLLAGEMTIDLPAAERASAAEVETARAALAEMARFAKAFAVSRARADFDGHARADARFHLTILEASRNQFLAQMAAIIESGLKLHNEYVAGLPRALERGLSYHRKVLRAIEARDPAAAGAAMSALLAFAGRDQRAHQRSERQG